MSDPDEFEQVTNEELVSATEEELIEQIMNLQQEVYAQRAELDDLRELVYFVLDLQAGIAEDTHPDLFDAVNPPRHDHPDDEDSVQNHDSG